MIEGIVRIVGGAVGVFVIDGAFFRGGHGPLAATSAYPAAEGAAVAAGVDP